MEDELKEKKTAKPDKTTTPWDGAKKNNPSPMDRYIKKMNQLKKGKSSGKY